MGIFSPARTVILMVCLYAFLPGPALADVMEGDHLLLFGAGGMNTSLHLAGVQNNFDFDGDGIPDSIGLEQGTDKIRNGYTLFLQYYYHWSPSWAFGFSFERVTVKGTGSFNTSQYSFSGGPGYLGPGLSGIQAQATSNEFIPMLRYTLNSYRQINPYLVGGAGLNRLSASASVSYLLERPPGNPIYQPGISLYHKTSIGLAATLGGGAQAMLTKHLLAGVEGRWIYCRTDPNITERPSWNRFEGALWIGTKFNAPL